MEAATARGPVGFAISNSDLVFRGLYSEPVFALLQNGADLCQGLYGALKDYGVGLSDIKLETGSGTTADLHLFVSVLSTSTVIRVRLDSVEVHCLNLKATGGERIGELAVGVLEAVKRHSEAVQFNVFTVAIAMHGALEGIPVTDFVQKYSRLPAPNLGPLTGSGAVFYYGAVGDQIQAALTLDHSATLTGGLFLRPTVVWDAVKVPLSRLRIAGQEFYDAVLRELGLEVTS